MALTAKKVFGILRKKINGVATGYKSSKVTDDADGGKTLTITFVNGDTADIKFDKIKGDKGVQGIQGLKGEQGEKGDKGDIGDDGFSPTITEKTKTEDEYVLTITDKSGSTDTPNLHGKNPHIYSGELVTSTQEAIVVIVEGSNIGDLYINSNTDNYYLRTDKDGVLNTWTYEGNLKGEKGDNNYEVWKTIAGNEDKTKEDYYKELSGEVSEVKVVASKPDLNSEDTELKCWYYYQVDGSKANTAWKVKLDLPTTANLSAGKYYMHYKLRYYLLETTKDVPALTDKDTYKYYMIGDMNTSVAQIYKESIADGTVTLLETAQGTQQADKPTGYTLVYIAPNQLGKWCQTLYISPTGQKVDAEEITLSTGVDVAGFVTNTELEELLGTTVLNTTNKKIREAINELNNLLRTGNDVVLNTTNKTVISAINELVTDVNKKEDKSNKVTIINSNSTDDEYPSAKAVYEFNKIKTYTKLEQLGLESGCSTGDVFNALPDNSYFEIGCNLSKTDKLYHISDIPLEYGLLTIRKYDKTRFSIELKPSGGSLISPNELYIGQLKGSDGSNLSWKRVCTTDIADIEPTLINLDSKYFDTNVKAYYEVTNGVCYINFMTGNFSHSLSTALINTVVAEGLPKPKQPQVPHTFVPWASQNKQVLIFVNRERKMIMYASENMANACVYTSFSYPVAEE